MTPFYILLVERNWGTQEHSCKYFIHLWWWCSKVEAGLSSKVECSWGTGDLLFYMCQCSMPTQCHKLIICIVGLWVEEEARCSGSTYETKT